MCILFRSQIVLSESLSRQSPKSPYRRAPSAFVKYSGSSPALPMVPPINLEESTENVLKVAKSEIARLNQKLERKRVSYHTYIHTYICSLCYVWYIHMCVAVFVYSVHWSMAIITMYIYVYVGSVHCVPHWLYSCSIVCSVHILILYKYVYVRMYTNTYIRTYVQCQSDVYCM